MRTCLTIALLLLCGCSKAPTLSEEDLLTRYQTSKEEFTRVQNDLNSSDVKNVKRGLIFLQKKPLSAKLYRAEITNLNQHSKDPEVQAVTTHLLNGP
ncbi:hypothetical protein SAMN05421753_10223 [Planctomicrobium piriforme]|uniref:Uncharacterized protein n=1 Tax=Planctomicrobium piriforme TaxID=1576369 RepID=A0A1I3C0N3_9PLAN|nr:hypothetical protein SAMN05421753_10223 [Planctomicrobium piriforme]